MTELRESAASGAHLRSDINHDKVLAREEAGKELLRTNHFNEMGIKQDGKVTREEVVASMKMKERQEFINGKASKSWPFYFQ